MKSQHFYPIAKILSYTFMVVIFYACKKESITISEEENETSVLLSYTLIPKDNTTKVGLSQNLKIAFNQPDISIGKGKLTIYKSDGSVFEEIVASSDKVVSNGQGVFTIHPSKDFQENTSYHIHVEDNFFGNNFSGISDEQSWDISTNFTFQKRFFSEVVQDTYELHISLPEDYQTDGKGYPVLYYLDAFSFRADAWIDYVHQMVQNGEIQPIILVGIGYIDDINPDGSINWSNNHRNRDYTHPVQGRDYGWGERFYDAIEQEIIPYVESNYPVNKDFGNTIFGHSHGGQFSLLALSKYDGKKNNNPFQHFVSASPSISNEFFTFEESQSKKNNDLPVSVIMSIGELEDPAKFNEVVTTLKSRNYKSFDFQNIVVSGARHGYAETPTFYYTLGNIF